MKGLSTILVAIIFTMIIISLVGLFYVWSSQQLINTASSTQTYVGNMTGRIVTAFRVISINGNSIVLKNIGSTEISTDNLIILSNGLPVDLQIPEKIGPGKIGTIAIPNNSIVGNITIVGGGSIVSNTFQGPSTYRSNNENETYSCVGPCSLCSFDLYVLENQKIKFFTSTVPAYKNTTPTTGSACLATPLAQDNRYSASPMRIWAKDSDSYKYRKNNNIIDQTSFSVPSLLTFTFSDPNNVTLYPDKIIYRGDTASNLEPTVIYSMLPDSNYVKVELRVKNVGGSAQSIRLRWSGDQDPPTGNWTDDKGEFNKNAPTVPMWATKWFAFNSTYNDVYGLIADQNNLNISLSINDGSTIEQISTTTVNPGDTLSMIFYFVSDFKGPSGYNWKPIEDVYKKLYP